MTRDDVVALLRGDSTYKQVLDSCAPGERDRVAHVAEQTCAMLFESLATMLSGTVGQAILTQLKNGSA